MSDDTRSMDRPWYEQHEPRRGGGASAASGDERTYPTDELDLDGGARDATRPMRPMREPEPTTDPLPVVDDQVTERFPSPIGPSHEPPATQVLDPVVFGPPTAGAPSPHGATPPAPPRRPMQPSRPSPPAHPVAPVPPAGSQGAYRPVPRPVGPNGFARFGSVVLALALAGPGVFAVGWALLLSSVSVVAEAAVEATQAFGVELPELPGGAVRLLLLIGGAILVALAALTARMSGLGVGIAGLVLLVTGVISLIVPSAVADWVLTLPFVADGFATIDGADGVVRMIGTLASVFIGTTSLVVGGAFLAVAGAVHGARQAGWDRGTGV